ncbi:uncharacterized protein LOC143020258 isoform X2 [Oratosquilla oratoria]|uniref:uncharacterized protein LOC143020258 isoform X2 n=2 Tax=Oratosquilla oratoria TaxID=337810 RepID=UPI003F76C6DB
MNLPQSQTLYISCVKWIYDEACLKPVRGFCERTIPLNTYLYPSPHSHTHPPCHARSRRTHHRHHAIMGSSSDDDGGQLMVKEEGDSDDMTLWDSHGRCSAFSPYRPVTVLTNLQRGNIQTQTAQIEPEDLSIHVRAAMGELKPEDFEKGIDMEEVDAHGFTPIMWSASYGQLPTVKLLIQNRVRMDVEGADGETALLLAASNGHHEVVKLLISFGSDQNHMDHMGNTALMYAAHGDHAHCVNELLDSGADLTATNVAGTTAFNIAVARGSKQVQIVMEKFLLKLLEGS